MWIGYPHMPEQGSLSLFEKLVVLPKHQILLINDNLVLF
jgi:hypothetical protein